jgi:trimethylamine--corrinoid protein Co-methyltransferase
MKVLTQDDIQRIHEATLDVLASRGVVFHDNPEAVEILKSYGCQANGFQVRFPRQLVEEAMAQVPDRDTLKFCVFDFPDEISLKQGESHVGVIGNAYYIYDYEKGTHRDCVEADLEDKFLIADSLRHIEFDVNHLTYHSERHGGAVEATYDTAEAQIAFVRRRVTDRSRVADLTGRSFDTLPMRTTKRSSEECRLEAFSYAVLRGAEAAGDLLEKNDNVFVWCNPVSPLQFHPEEAQGIIRVARTNWPNRWAMISPAIMMGTTGPVTLASTLVQQNAEVLAGTVLAQLAGPGTPVIYGCVSSPADLRTAEAAAGSLEAGLLNVAAVQLADHYGMPSRIAPGTPGDRKPSVRAAVEQAVGLHMGLAAGGNLITTGLLDSLLMLSYEHLVLLDELVGQVKHITRGIDTTDEISMAVDVINEHGHPSPGFLTADHTLKHMKRDIYYSDYTGRTAKSYEGWYDKAHSRVKQVLDRKLAEVHLDPAVQERLAAVEARLKEDPDTWREDLPPRERVHGEREPWRKDREAWWFFYVQDL